MSSQAISVLELLDRFLHSLSLSVPNSDCDAIKQKFKVCTCPKKTKSEGSFETHQRERGLWNSLAEDNIRDHCSGIEIEEEEY
ncbi:hypothetical protein RHGRI_005600 [Rhododendron griersonianum]|uniref:Uncharacterized protein n=1 Tax=Rhododendron griersonianum TaxID=479676 RepID=A0AAV6LFS0_9ERIC|nr:hypothetical protein RHGRI_005600 [Rhododendron griersonianum]